jgi:glyoxylase-like metal-dependent hydrolase (beta-lactamase superfamily II)
LIECDSGLVLVDTGLGTRDVAEPSPRLSRFFLNMMRPPLKKEMTAVEQIRRLGFDPSDVRHIVLTHLDFDHAGGLDDFPQATVHLNATEFEAAHERRTFIAKRRYRPDQFEHVIRLQTYRPGGEKWFGFDSIRNLEGISEDIFLIPLVGHTYGHCGVAVRDGDSWLLHAGDAYFYRGEMDVRRPRCTPGLRFYQRMMEVDRKSRLENQERLRELIRDRGHLLRVISAHDPVEFERARRFGLHLPSDHEATVPSGLQVSPFAAKPGERNRQFHA